ncbi:MAG TPA: thiamine pyrophosphate-dependent enzyme, partial [Bryobacteraceae bacterium]|nr:thiamine pyrophosphate-dependent enzyme [Bryobacteraceae bacterium]
MKLSDKFTLEEGRVYLTGIQALVRLPIDQMRRDRRAGLNTGAFISGYEGSPLGGYDMALARAGKLLSEYNIHFRPGVNEDLAATAVFGSQIIDAVGQSKVDSVLGIWYGKGPGVDRSGDIFRHANLSGSGRGGALLLCGDDPISKSSTIPSQSDFSLYNIGIPYLYPGSVQEILDYGALAIALSRFSGAWVAMKMVTDVCDGGGTVELDPDRPAIRWPEGYERHTDVRIVAPVTLGLEHEVNVRRVEAARQFARLNAVNRHNGAEARIGVLSTGKSYFDLMQALRDLGIRDGVRIGKVGMPFPLDPDFVRDFARGLETVLVVEEKRSFLEMQLREILYDLPSRPAVLGKSHFPPTGELDPDKIAEALADVLGKSPRSLPSTAQPIKVGSKTIGSRPSAFCSGCPHNRSTMLLEGQIAGGGIGCHTMAMRLNDPSRSFSFLTHMGGEGAPWIGMTPFVDQKHIFQNIGDGTLFHSGYLAIEACVAAKVNITYKILYNGHVAMTGGQDAVGALPIPDLTRKLQAEGVRRTIVLAEDTEKYASAGELASNAELRSRDELPRTLRE